MAGDSFGNDKSGLAFGKNEVQNCEVEVPCHNKQVGKDLGELLSDTHDERPRAKCLFSRDANGEGRLESRDQPHEKRRVVVAPSSMLELPTLHIPNGVQPAHLRSHRTSVDDQVGEVE